MYCKWKRRNELSKRENKRVIELLVNYFYDVIL